MKNQAFTLIELLVVVLIIGILSAIALPQYTKAVEKSRMAEALQTSATLRQALDLQVLSNGYEEANLTADLLGQLNCNESGFCCSKYFCYSAFCNEGSCQVAAYRYQNGDMENGDNLYDLDWWKIASYGGTWTTGCVNYEETWGAMCTFFSGL